MLQHTKYLIFRIKQNKAELWKETMTVTSVTVVKIKFLFGMCDCTVDSVNNNNNNQFFYSRLESVANQELIKTNMTLLVRVTFPSCWGYWTYVDTGRYDRTCLRAWNDNTSISGQVKCRQLLLRLIPCCSNPLPCLANKLFWHCDNCQASRDSLNGNIYWSARAIVNFAQIRPSAKWCVKWGSTNDVIQWYESCIEWYTGYDIAWL